MRQLLFITTLLLSALALNAQVQVGDLHVTARDSSGAVLPGVIITGSGPVEGTARTDAEGVAKLIGLPFGDYLVVTKLPGFVESRTAIKIAGIITDHFVELKVGPLEHFDPRYPKPIREIYSTGCDVPSPVELESFWTVVDVVAHVRVVGRRAEDHQPVPNASLRVITWNEVLVVENFKSHSRWSPQGAVADVAQPGGELDRGDYIEVVTKGSFPQFAVGREYVLFLQDSDWYRGWTVAFCAQGALAVDGETIAAHHSGDFPRRWEGRPVVDLIAALRALKR